MHNNRNIAHSRRSDVQQWLSWNVLLKQCVNGCRGGTLTSLRRFHMLTVMTLKE